MQNISLQNSTLKKLLSNIAEEIFSNEDILDAARKSERIDDLIEDHRGDSIDYFNEAFNKRKLEEYGYPRCIRGIGMLDYFEKATGENKLQSFDKFNTRLTAITSFLSARNNALAMIYPEDAYIGWHHNGNAPGYNVLLTYSEDGDGDFSYWDYDKNEIVELKDKKGWSCKVGYYPNAKQTEKVLWHKATTKKPRVTLAWVVPDKDIWLDMIDEISDGNEDLDRF